MMIGFFFWITLLFWNLFLIAGVIAFASRCKSTFWRRFWPLLIAFIQCLFFAGIVLSGANLLKNNQQPKSFFWYGLLLFILYIAGTAFVLKKGMRGTTSDKQAAAAWPRLKLAVAFGIVLVFNLFCLEFMQLNVMNDLINARAAATANLLNLMPPKIPDAFNARAAYEKAIKALPKGNDLPDWFQESLKPGFDTTRPEVASFIQQQKKAMAMAKKAACMPGYHVEVNPMNYINWSITDYSGYRNLAKLLSLDARCRAYSGDAEGAMENLAAMQHMSVHLDNTPFLISFVIANSIDEMRVNSLEYVLAHGPDLHADIIPVPVKSRPTNLMRLSKALRLEAYGQLQGFTILAATNNILSSTADIPSTPPNPTTATKIWRAFFLLSDLRAAKDIITDRMSRQVASYAELQANLKAIVNALESGQMGIFTSIGASGYSDYVIRAKRRDALEGLADLAMAAAVYKAVKGQYPQQTDDLVPDFIVKIPDDPFDGQSLKLEPRDDGIDLYTAKPEPASDLMSASDNKGAIHFYIGRELYKKSRY